MIQSASRCRHLTILVMVTSAALATATAQILPLPARHTPLVTPPVVISSPGVLADVDGDGDADLVNLTRSTVISHRANLSVLRASNGKFDPAVSVATNGFATNVNVADLDDDGDLDAAVVAYSYQTNGPEIWLHTNDGAGNFTAAATVLASSRDFYGVDFVDFDNDGVLDLHLRDAGGHARFRRGLGSLAFGPEITAPFSSALQFLFDDDGDGDSDIHEVGAIGELHTSRNDGNGGFSSPTLRCNISPDVYWVRFSDLNGDGFVDALLAGGRQGPDRTVVQVAFGDATGALTPGPAQVVAPVYVSAAPVLYDLNGDGRDDLVIAEGSNREIVVSVRNDGSGTFLDAQVMHQPEHTRPSPLTGDVNGDGLGDLLVGEVLYLSLGNRLEAAVEIPLPVATGTFAVDPTMKLGDFDLDGIPDAVCGMAEQGIVLARNFAKTPVITHVQIGGLVHDLALGDWNRDGHLDVLVARSLPDSLQLLLGNSAGALAPQPVHPLSEGPIHLRAADMNGDGNPDAVVVGTGIDVLLGDGLGGFTGPISSTICTGGCGQLANPDVADFNQDGILDIGIGYQLDPWNPQTYSTFLGVGTGALHPPIQSTGSVANSLVVDFDGDGLVDRVASQWTYLEIQPGLGNGTFGAGQTYSILGPTHSAQFTGAMAVGDIDGDGRPDLAFAGGAVIRSQGNSLAPPQYHYIGGGSAVEIADVDGDLQRDVVVLHRDGRLTILPNTTATSGGGVELGLGCPGSGGFAPTATVRGLAQPGSSITMNVDGALGGALGWIVLGPTPVTAPVGFGCRLYVDYQGLITRFLPLTGAPVAGGGSGSWTLPIPSGLGPLTLAGEAIVLDFASPLAFSGTNGVVIDIR